MNDNFDYMPLPNYYMMTSMRRIEGGITVGFYMFTRMNSGFAPDLEYHVRYINGRAKDVEIFENAGKH